jgi:hypothetical protein
MGKWVLNTEINHKESCRETSQGDAKHQPGNNKVKLKI